MAYPTEEDYENLRLDMVSTGLVTNSAPDAADIVTRTARVIKPLAKVLAQAEQLVIDQGVEEEIATVQANRAVIATPWLLLADLAAATGAVDGYSSTVTADSGTHIAVSGEVALGGSAATVGAAIPNNGRYTRVSGAWLRTADLDGQTSTTIATSISGTLAYYSDNVRSNSVVRGSNTADTSDPSTSNVQFHQEPTKRACTLTSVSARFSATGTGEIHIVTIAPGTKTATLISKTPVTVSATGLNTFPLNIAVPAGAYIGYKRLTGVNIRTTTGGRNFTVPGGSLTTVGNTGPVTAATAEQSLSYTVTELEATLNTQLNEFRSRNRTALALSTGWNHVVGYGQSLSIGADAIAIINSVASSYHKTFNVGEKMTKPGWGGLAGTSDDGLTKALVEDTNSPFSGTTGETSLSAFAREFSRRYSRARGTPPIWFASTAGRGGQPIASLDFLSSQYENFIYHVTAGKAAAVAAGKAYTVPFVLYKQGEADQAAATSKTLYKKLLSLLIDRFKQDVIATTGQANPPQWIFSTPVLSITTSANATEAQLELCDERDDCWFSAPLYRFPQVNSSHPSAAGQILLGHYESRVATQLATGQTPGRLRWLGASANGTAFTARISGPSAVAFNTTIIGAATDNGIKIVDDTGTLTLSSMVIGTSVQNVNTGLWETPITCTLNRSLGANPKFRYARDYLGTGLIPSGGASGNVFDTSPETAVISGTTYSLAHPAPPVELAVYVEE